LSPERFRFRFIPDLDLFGQIGKRHRWSVVVVIIVVIVVLSNFCIYRFAR
jgi:hypothetical protein